MSEDGRQLTEFIPGRLYFEVVKQGERLPFSDALNMYFTTDDTFVYTPLKDDNGPLNISMIFKYCTLLRDRMKDTANTEKKLYHVTNGHDSKRTNAALLMGSYMVIVMNQTPEQAIAPFNKLTKFPFVTFLDCWKSAHVPGITLLDCFTGIYKAIQHGFFDFKTFNSAEYDLRQEVQQGDMNWVIPNRILAFKGPRTKPKVQPSFSPDFYLPHLQKMGVSTVVRLNKDHYDRGVFVNAGMKHHELYFSDGTIPTFEIVEQFLKIVEEERGGIAVHCKGGVGRTGTLICCCLISHYNFTANEGIAWVRVCRPGSVMGAQHTFLLDYYQKKKVPTPVNPEEADPGVIETADLKGDAKFASPLVITAACESENES